MEVTSSSIFLVLIGTHISCQFLILVIQFDNHFSNSSDSLTSNIDVNCGTSLLKIALNLHVSVLCIKSGVSYFLFLLSVCL